MLWQPIVMNWRQTCCFSFAFRNDQPVQDEEPTHDSYWWVILLSWFFIVSIDAGMELMFCPTEPEKHRLLDNDVTCLTWWCVCSLYSSVTCLVWCSVQFVHYCHMLGVMQCAVCTLLSHAWCDVVCSLYITVTCLTWWCVCSLYSSVTCLVWCSVQFVHYCHMLGVM